jgi:putative transposase
MSKAPLGKGATGKNPTDRAKIGTKRSMLTDGAGIPLAVAVEGANRHDAKLLVATLDGLVIARPAAEGEEPDSYQQHLSLVLGRGLRLGGGAPRAGGQELRAPHLCFR